MMKKLPLILVILLLPLLSFAQSSVNAADIVAKINRGEAVSYKNVVITGDLNMTKLKNMKQKGNNGDNSSREFLSVVTVPLTFVNCTFRGDVLAYFNPDNGRNMVRSINEVYNTDFAKEVRFENCTFEQESAFKYSAFKGGASFAGSRFAEEALFKYSDFDKLVNFSQARFSDDANFKYVSFPVTANFSGAVFGGEANFKYAKFAEGVSFQKAVFDGLANFKYAKLSEPFNLRGASFKGDDDFKYTSLNNQSVTLSSLQQDNQ
ncbi:pentapeptide repeat-containing protein [Pontibacter liquoris]|uniref:pentapeptide repeat-containing protein n=1 Tax=Pontibacter liquoris TaxID=2905677 RepID=UPI001FA7F6F6|nr:pentapeptide repeat-containing protein [Pontibacter liquoris]